MATAQEMYNEAEKLKDSGQTEAAIAKMSEIAEQFPEHVLTHLALAKLYTATGEHQKAVAHGEKACELEPEEWFNFTALSMTYQRAWAGTQDQNYIRLAEDAMARSRLLEQR